MTTPDVQGTITPPSGSVPLGTKVRLRLVASGQGDAPAFAYTVDGTMVGGADAWARPNKSGLFTFPDVNPIADPDDLTPSDDAINLPEGCVYQLCTVYPDGTEILAYHDIADVAGPVVLGPGTITTAPSNLPPAGATNASVGGAYATGTVADLVVLENAIDTRELADAAAGPDQLAGTVVGYVDPLTDLTGWTDADTVIPAAYDALGVVPGGVGVPSPSSGSIGSAIQGAGHGLRYKNLGLTAPCSVMVQIDLKVWPAEGGPALFVDLTKDEGWFAPVFSRDLVPPDPPNPYFWIGNGGKTNANITFLDGRPFTEDEEDKYLDHARPADPVWIEVRVDADWWATMWVDGVQISDVTAQVPVALRGSTSHGFYVDVNASDENGGAGGTRPADLPVICGAFVARSLLADATDDAVAGGAEATLHAGAALTKVGGKVQRLTVEPVERLYSRGDVAQPAFIVRNTDGTTDVIAVDDDQVDLTADLVSTADITAAGPIESTDGNGRATLGDNGAGQTAVTVKGPADRTLASIGYIDFGGNKGGLSLDDEAGSAAAFSLIKTDDFTASLGGTSRITGAPDAVAASDLTPLSQVQSLAAAGLVLLDQSATAVTVNGTITETNLLSYSIATAAVGDVFELWAHGTMVNNSGSTFATVLTCYLGASTIGVASISNGTSANAKRWRWGYRFTVGDASLAVQEGFTELDYTAAGAGSTTLLAATRVVLNRATTENLATAKTLRLTATHADASASITTVCRGYTIERTR